MEIEKIVIQIVTKLEKYNSSVQSNIKKLIEYFNDSNNLTVEEQKATQISFWRSIDDKSCSAFIEYLNEEEYIENIKSRYHSYPIFENWNDCFDWQETFGQFEDDELKMETLETEIEVAYLQWFINNWYRAEGHLSKNIEYYLIENNSVRNFDLKRFNFTDLFPNHKGIMKENPYYDFKLKGFEIRNRVLTDMVDHTYHMPIIRKLKLGAEQIVFWYSQCELIVRKIQKDDMPKILLAKKVKSSENKYRFKSEQLSYMTMEIEKLLGEGYREIE